MVDHARRGGDQVEIIFAGQPLLDDLEVEEAEEAAAEAEAQRRAGLHLEAEAGVVEAQLGEEVAQLLEIGGVDREEAAEDDRLDLLEAGQRLRAPGLRASVIVSPTRVSVTSLIWAVMKPISPGRARSAARSSGGRRRRGRPGGWCRRHELDLLALADRAVDHADQDDDAEIGVVPAVDEHRLQRRVRRRPWAAGCGRRSPRAPRRCRCRSWRWSARRRRRGGRRCPRSPCGPSRRRRRAGRSC